MAQSPPPSDQSYRGGQEPHTSNNDYNAMSFIIRAITGRYSTSMPVEVMAVGEGVGVAPVGYVDVRPMVNQIDGYGDAVPHGTIFNVPYMRIQGGRNAIIIDPVVGDIGIACFASHDISAVKANKAVANPGSLRRFDMSDAIYIGGILNGAPENFVMITDNEITVKHTTKVIIEAPEGEINTPSGLTIVGPVTQSGGDFDIDANLTVGGEATVADDVTIDGISFNDHVHDKTGVGNNTQGPANGP